MKRLLLAALFSLGLVGSAPAQILFPGETGLPLRENMRASYHPIIVYPYDTARDTLFRRIYLEPGNQLVDVYSGHAITLDPAADPTTDASEKNIDAEHTFPQSMGAGEEPARGDLHHLFPVHEAVKSSRGNDPFADIPDHLATTWWLNGTASNGIPGSNINAYAESNGSQFEPREVHKGNAARAVFYFATMYEDRANQAFFHQQKETLLRWHRQDPPDSAETARSWQIAGHQGNINPYVHDTSLVRRAFFEGDQGSGSGTVAVYRFEGNATCPTTADTVDAQPAGLSFQPFRRSAVECANGAGVFNSQTWPQAFTENYYAAALVLPEAGRLIQAGDTSRVTFTVRRSGSGPPQGRLVLQWEDGMSEGETALGEWTLTSTNDTTITFPVRPGSYTRLDFRFHGWGATGPTGTLRFDDVLVSLGATSPVAVEDEEQPRGFVLHPVYPNPFNPSATLRFELPAAGHASLRVYNALGQEVAVLVGGPLAAGDHEVRWEAGAHPNGLYFATLRFGGELLVRRMVLVK